MSGNWTSDFEALARQIDEYLQGGGSLKLLARQTGVSRLTIKRWAKGRPPESIAIAAAIDRVLNRGA